MLFLPECINIQFIDKYLYRSLAIQLIKQLTTLQRHFVYSFIGNLDKMVCGVNFIDIKY